MLRHKSFKTMENFQKFLQNVASSDIYYSSAYFEKPEEEMDAKVWIGADLIFDIDADHIPTTCDKQHDTWVCKTCGTSGHGVKPKKCPKCKGKKFDEISWICDICLESAKKETIKLIGFLEKDFGFTPQEMKLAFSGHRGYHVHIENEAVRTLDSMARKEIVDYLIGVGLEPSLQGFDFDSGLGPSLDDLGWRGKIAQGTRELLSSPRTRLEKTGLKKISEDIAHQEERILESWKGKGPWGLVLASRSWEKIIQQTVDRQSVKIDTVVTTDIHRLIRLANTLHGETGLLKLEVPVNEIEGFDPFKSAVAFKHGTVTVEVADAPPLRLGNNTYGPYKAEIVELPTAAAMLLLCKGAAQVVEETVSVQ